MFILFVHCCLAVYKFVVFVFSIEVGNENGRKVKGTSLLKLLSLGIKKGAKVTIYADGNDEVEAVEKLGNLLTNLKD